VEESVCKGENFNNKNALKRHFEAVDGSSGHGRRMVSVEAVESKAR